MKNADLVCVIEATQDACHQWQCDRQRKSDTETAVPQAAGQDRFPAWASPVFGLATPIITTRNVPSLPAWLWWAIGLLVAAVVASVPALWRLHRVHHSSERMDWLAAAHLHPFDGSIGRLLAVIVTGVLAAGCGSNDSSGNACRYAIASR